MEKRFLCIMGMFDEETNAKFDAIREKLNLAGIQYLALPPHITLGAYVGVDENELCDWLETLASSNESIEMNFNHLGLFSLKVAFLAPRVSPELTSFHQKIHEKFDDQYSELGYDYTIQSNNWVPHSTILIDEPDVILKSIPIINENFDPFIGHMVSLCVCEFNPIREIRCIKLK